MIWVLLIVVAVLVIGAFAALVAGRIPYDPMAEATSTAHDPRLGEDFHAHDVSGVRFDTALRGYRMDQVDTVLDQLRDRIARLEGEAHAEPGGAAGAEHRRAETAYAAEAEHRRADTAYAADAPQPQGQTATDLER